MFWFFWLSLLSERMEKKYRLILKDTDPDTGQITRHESFAIIICTEKIAAGIIQSLSWNDAEPNREYTYEEDENYPHQIEKLD